MVCVTAPKKSKPSRPRTKKRCRLKKTAMGARIEKKPAAVSRCQLSLRLPASDAMACVSTMLSPEPRKIRATSRSFHTQRNWKIAKLASAGFFKEWKGKYGDEAWSVLERYAGKIS